MNVNENYWLKNKHNCCLYDAFITMYLFSINNKFNPFNNSILNEFIKIVQNIIKDQNYYLRFSLWKKLINKNIDINSDFDNGFSKMGCIVNYLYFFRNRELLSKIKKRI